MPGEAAYRAWCDCARAYLPWEELERSDQMAWGAFEESLAVDYAVVF